MKPEQQQIAIAEACGWKDCDVNNYQKPPLLLGSKPSRGCDGEDFSAEIHSYTVDQRIPEYTKDANTRPEMLAVLEKRGLKRHFVNNVCVLSAAPAALPNDGAGWSDEDVWNCLSVSQPLFCKAFLATLNLWTE